jgi:maleylacetate reductase
MHALHAFCYEALPARIVFGAGARARLGDELERLGPTRALLLCTASQRALAQSLAERLGSRAAGIFSGAAMHTPVEVTAQALRVYEEVAADCIIAVGGGTATGLGKAIAWRNDAPQIVLPTTYAGSEVTPVLGQTENGAKTTLRDRRVLPEVVLYDPELTLGLPVAVSIASGLNAIAHAAEGLYARDRNPVASLAALEGIRALREALPALVSDPLDLLARSQAQYGAWLCGSVLGTVGMALHHKLCHVLGGAFNLPHADTHAIVLPHVLAYNAPAAADCLRPLDELFGVAAAAGLQAFAAAVGAPRALRDIGLQESQVDQAADLAMTSAYWNPRPLQRDAIRALLHRAWRGDPAA